MSIEWLKTLYTRMPILFLTDSRHVEDANVSRSRIYLFELGWFIWTRALLVYQSELNWSEIDAESIVRPRMLVIERPANP